MKIIEWTNLKAFCLLLACLVSPARAMQMYERSDSGNIRLNVLLDSVVSSTPQIAYLYSIYDGNNHIIDSVNVNGQKMITLSGYLPYQNEVELIFEKRGPVCLGIILTPGDSICFKIPQEQNVSSVNYMEISGLTAQSEWVEYNKKNVQLRENMRMLANRMASTDSEVYEKMKKAYIQDSLKLHQLYVDLVSSDNPYLVDHSLLFLNMDYHEDSLYKDNLLKKFPGYKPIYRSYNIIKTPRKTEESRAIRKKIDRIKKKRTAIQYAGGVLAVKAELGNQLNILLHKEDGEIDSLSNYNGNFVLVEFWASWCIPCIEKMPDIIAAKERFTKELDICAITIDRLPGAWKRRIETAKLIQMNHYIGVDFSNGKMFSDIEQLGIKAIPQNYLLDREGKIIAINIYGEELIKKLEELTKK